MAKSWQPEELFRSLPPQPNAVGNPDAVVGVAREPESRQSGYARGDARSALLVPDGILRHGAAPAGHLRVLRFDLPPNRLLTQYLAQLAAHDGNQRSHRLR